MRPQPAVILVPQATLAQEPQQPCLGIAVANRPRPHVVESVRHSELENLSPAWTSFALRRRVAVEVGYEDGESV